MVFQPNCPLCACSEHHPRYSVVPNVRQCNHCGLVYAQSNAVKDFIEFYQDYGDVGSHMVWPGIEKAKESALRRFDFIHDLRNQGVGPELRHGDALDVGCGWGAFMLTLRDEGMNVSGIEICRKMAFRGREALGLNISTEPLENYPELGFDVISMMHVFEHMPRPLEALSQVIRRLQPGGWFIGIVPNFGSYCSKTLGKDWYWLDANYHYVHYTKETLQSALEKAGFTRMSFWTRIGDYTRSEVSRVVASVNPGMLPEAVVRFVNELEGRGLGEELRFVAQK